MKEEGGDVAVSLLAPGYWMPFAAIAVGLNLVPRRRIARQRVLSLCLQHAA